MKEKNMLAKSPFPSSGIREITSVLDFQGKKTKPHTDRFTVKECAFICEKEIAPYQSDNLC